MKALSRGTTDEYEDTSVEWREHTFWISICTVVIKNGYLHVFKSVFHTLIDTVCMIHHEETLYYTSNRYGENGGRVLTAIFKDRPRCNAAMLAAYETRDREIEWF
ncbi:hypothetical protein OUZ56_020116 [Daphnia magna]|uniref:Uncharacterized protein n=1 Tax=Daphnia magna TaxID=35525 RepID=A0ABQ9ZDK5_9CRUS|nr:hypothetical protein OUZ56_020116 [Daphnia magna]